ncbi:hypothetical protein TWF481_000359 [Arthrobotrys musiformis]|uniref:HNH nuclease domain-containing protein n=1 Tax=Arthrobotrys musiformis TaxID=47236 RepID=A0AAV9WMD8_9PEZI
MPNDPKRKWSAFLFLSSDPDVRIGGCYHKHYTQRDFYDFIEILVIPDISVEEAESLPGRLEVRRRGEQSVLANSDNFPLSPGDYIISSSVPLYVTNELFLDHVMSSSTTPRAQAFRESVRARDRECVIDQRSSSDSEDYAGLEVAHIWPLSQGSEWLRQGYGRFITDSDGVPDEGKMNSPQNGILLSGHIHTWFDAHRVAVNPRKGYKVYVFGSDRYELSGKRMKVSARENGDRGVRDALLMWHFRQCVLKNMRGSGEPSWDYGPNEGGDVVGRLLSSCDDPDRAMARLGHEVAARLSLSSFTSSSQSSRNY